MKSLYIVILISLSALFTINCKDEYGFDPDEEARLVREAFEENGIHIPVDMNFFEGNFYFDYYNGESKLRYNKTDFSNITPLLKVKSLSRLNLNKTTIKSLEGIGELTNLTYLSATNTGLTKIPDDIKHCSKLRKIMFQENMISDMGIGFSHIKPDSIILMKNKISIIPKELFNNTNLVELILHSNEIDSLDLSELNLPKIKEIGLANNKISSFPIELYNLTNLEELYLKFNAIDQSTIDSTKLIHLKKFVY